MSTTTAWLWSGTDPELNPSRRNPWRAALLLFAAAWVFLSLRLLILYRGVGVPLSLGDAFGSGLMESAVWLPFAALSIRLARRTPLALARPLATLVRHLPLACLVSFGQLATFALVSALFRSLRFGDPFDVNLWSAGFSMFVPGVAVYAVIVLAVRWRDERDERSVSVSPRVSPQEPKAPLELRVGRGTLLLEPTEIDWVRAAGNYLEVHTNSGTHLVRETLNGLFARLGEEEFQRVHRSTLVRRAVVAAVEARDETAVILRDGTRLRVGKTYRDALLGPESRPNSGTSANAGSSVRVS